MSASYFISVYGAFLSPIIIGFCLAKFTSLNSANVLPLIRNILFPIVIFDGLRNSFIISNAIYVIGIGAVCVVLVHFISLLGGKFIPPLAGLNSFPNVALFTIPFFAVALNKQGFSTVCQFFLGSALGHLGLNAKRMSWQNAIKEPWAVAAIVAIIVSLTRMNISFVNNVIQPMRGAIYPIILIYLGCCFNPIPRFDKEAFISIGTRMASGFVIAFLAIRFLPINHLSKAVMLAAISPPGSFGTLDRSNGADYSEKIGILVGIVVFISIIYFNLRPWNLRLF